MLGRVIVCFKEIGDVFMTEVFTHCYEWLEKEVQI